MLWDEAEDIAQDVFVQVFESLGRFRFESKLSTWLYRIAVNRSINHCKSPRGRAIKIDIDSWKQQEVAQSVEMPQQQILEEQEQIELLHKAIDKLPENQRTAFNTKQVRGAFIQGNRGCHGGLSLLRGIAYFPCEK